MLNNKLSIRNPWQADVAGFRAANFKNSTSKKLKKKVFIHKMHIKIWHRGYKNHILVFQKSLAERRSIIENWHEKKRRILAGLERIYHRISSPEDWGTFRLRWSKILCRMRDFNKVYHKIYDQDWRKFWKMMMIWNNPQGRISTSSSQNIIRVGEILNAPESDNAYRCHTGHNYQNNSWYLGRNRMLHIIE